MARYGPLFAGRYFYGLCFATLRAVVLARARVADSVRPPALDDATHARLFAPLPLGFLCPRHLRADNYGAAFVEHVRRELGAVSR